MEAIAALIAPPLRGGRRIFNKRLALLAATRFQASLSQTNQRLPRFRHDRGAALGRDPLAARRLAPHQVLNARLGRARARRRVLQLRPAAAAAGLLIGADLIRLVMIGSIPGGMGSRGANKIAQLISHSSRARHPGVRLRPRVSTTHVVAPRRVAGSERTRASSSRARPHSSPGRASRLVPASPNAPLALIRGRRVSFAGSALLLARSRRSASRATLREPFWDELREAVRVLRRQPILRCRTTLTAGFANFRLGRRSSFCMRTGRSLLAGARRPLTLPGLPAACSACSSRNKSRAGWCAAAVSSRTTCAELATLASRWRHSSSLSRPRRARCAALGPWWNVNVVTLGRRLAPSSGCRHASPHHGGGASP